MHRHPNLVLACFLLFAALAVVGCGEGGASAGASVSVYVAAPLCKGAEAELDRAGRKAGDLGVRAICLPPVELQGRIELATSGANARRTTEDSTSVAFLEKPGPAAKFSRTIVESAEIAWLEAGDGAAAMRRVLKSLDDRGSSSPRAAVRESL
jgi:hypothetical protein